MKLSKILLMLLSFAVVFSACKKDEDKIPSDVSGTWQAEYSGYDAMQETTVYIRRELTINGNGSYTNKIGGKTSESGDYDLWEEESGSCSVSDGQISYTVNSDKKVDFNTNTLQASSKSNYSERLEISNGEWITKDSDLKKSDSDSENVSYTMKKQ